MKKQKRINKKDIVEYVFVVSAFIFAGNFSQLIIYLYSIFFRSSIVLVIFIILVCIFVFESMPTLLFSLFKNKTKNYYYRICLLVYVVWSIYFFSYALYHLFK